MEKLDDESLDRQFVDAVQGLLETITGLMGSATIRIDRFSCDYSQRRISMVLRYGTRGRGTQPLVRVGYHILPTEITPLYPGAKLRETLSSKLEELEVYPLEARNFPESEVFWISIPAGCS